MRFVLVAVLLGVATASVIPDDIKTFVITKEPLVNIDLRVKEICILKLLNHILQPTVYDDIRTIAKEYILEENLDKYLKVDVVKTFIATYKLGMLPRGEIFVHMDQKQAEEAIKVFKLLYFAKDFDILVRTACWLRERINGGMFVYALTAAIFHRTDCNGISLPAPYEIYPYFFIDSNIIHKAFMMKMTKAAVDPVIKDYYGITVTDNNIVVIDWRKGLRHTMSEFDRTSYLTEDIDMNTYFYYLHMSYPYWLSDDIYTVNKERRGETLWYGFQQLLARLRLERLSHNMCDIKPFVLEETLKQGYWPKILLHTGDQMPVRSNNYKLITKDNIRYKELLEDNNRLIRDGIKKGYIVMRDGTTIPLKKPEDIENLSRYILGGYISKEKFLWTKSIPQYLLRNSNYNIDKHTYIPNSIDTYATFLRDPAGWKILKTLSEIFILFKDMLPRYTRDELDFPGVKIEHVTTDKLVTFFDDYNIDITNAIYLDKVEMQKQRSDMVYMARMNRLNHQPFKITIDIASDKAVDSIVRIFLGPKIDCMGRFISINDLRNDMLEIDTFLYKLETGKNTIVRNSLEMHGVIQERPWIRDLWHHGVGTEGGIKILDNWWYKSRIGFPNRLLLPMGTVGGKLYQLYVIVTPVRTGLILPTLDQTIIKQRHACRWSVCVDTMPLGFPFDRHIEEINFFTPNMKFHEVAIYLKLTLSNSVKKLDTSEMILKRDDLTYRDLDLLRSRTYKDIMLWGTENMTRI